MEATGALFDIAKETDDSAAARSKVYKTALDNSDAADSAVRFVDFLESETREDSIETRADVRATAGGET